MVDYDKKAVLKQGTAEQNVNAALVSEFLKKVLDNVQITMRGKKYKFYTPYISVDQDLDGNQVQKQEFLKDLNPNIDGKKIQGLASLDSIKEAAKLGVVYQFLMLGNNISHNNRITADGRFVIFNFDSAFKLGGLCKTSPDGIFHDKVVSVNHAYNDHFIDLLALKFKKDKYGYIQFNQAAINDLENETWKDFLLGVKEGLELIKANITEEYILNQWGKDIPPGNEAYLKEIKQLIKVRLANVDKNIAFLNDVLDQKRAIPGINITDSIKSTLSQQSNVSAYIDELKNAIAAEINKPALEEKLVHEGDLSKLAPAPYKSGPSKSKFSPGRLYDFSKDFERSGIGFNTDVSIFSNALAILTSTKIDQEGIHHPCTCNGPHHALIVAKFSYMMAGEMLAHESMKQKIDTIINGLNEDTKKFLTKDDYQNYKKLVELIALLHDSGRPKDGIDEWDATNEQNVITNIGYLLKTAKLSQQSIKEIMDHVKQGIENKDNLNLKDDSGFLFGCPIGAGDSLHSGHAFHGGKWDNRSYNPNYVRLYKQYPDFQPSFINIVEEVGQFVPLPTEQNGGKLAAVNKYLVWHQNDGDGSSIIKSDFSDLIHKEFNALDQMKFPIMAKHFPSRPLIDELTAETQIKKSQGANVTERFVLKDSQGDNYVTSVQEHNGGYKINGTNNKGDRRYIIIDKDGNATGYNGSKKLGIVEMQMSQNREAILKHFNIGEAPKAAEQKAAEQKAAEQKAAEQKAAEQKAAEQKAAEQKAAEQKAAEQKAAEQKAAEQKAAEQVQLLKDALTKHKQQFNSLLGSLKLKRDELILKVEKAPEYKTIADDMTNLCLTLDQEKNFFEKPSPELFQQFKRNCEVAIGLAETHANDHRGWYKVDSVIRAIVGVLAAIAVIPALIVERKSKHGFIQTFFAKPDTDSSQKIASFKERLAEQKEEIEDVIDKSATPPEVKL